MTTVASREPSETPPAEAPGPPGRRVRLIGRALTHAVAIAPWAWPLLRGPMRSHFDELAGSWDDRVDARGAAHLAPLALAVTKIGEPPERILDLGTGTGAAALFLTREFPNASVRGVDVSEDMIRRAKAKVGLDPEGRIAFKVADSADLPYEDEHFDLVTLLNMPPFFSEIARVLRPGGSAIVAASSGEQTPFYTPDSVLARGFRKQGMAEQQAGRIGAGTYFVASKP